MAQKASHKSTSTTAHTGELYTKGFSEGFISQNKDKIVNQNWMGVNIIVKEKSTHIIIGDVHFLCRTLMDVTLHDLFPITSKCDTNRISNIPAGTDIYIEVTSMSGELAIRSPHANAKEQRTKVQKKVAFFQRLFTESGLTHNSAMDLSYGHKIVLFVYNGADFTDLKDEFVSDFFTSAVVYLPMEHCIKWAKDLVIKDKDLVINSTNMKMRELIALLNANGISAPAGLTVDMSLVDSDDVEKTEIDSASK